jgi:putative DNA primase/helicase
MTARIIPDEPEVERDQHEMAAFEVADARPPEFSDESLALRFSAKHGGTARYVADWGKWLLWTGSFWTFDSTMHAFDLARAICRVASAEIDDPKQARMAAAVASAKTVAAVVSLSRADRRHAATIEQWDADPGLNTPGGIIDLRDGSMMPHDPELYMTKITAIAPGGECPLWLKFLAKITGGDAEL